DGIFAHLDEQSPKLRANLAEHEEQVRVNAEVMELVRDAPVGVTIEELDRRPADVDEVRRLFDFLEFYSLAERLTEALGEDLGIAPAAEVIEAEVTSLDDAAEAAALLDRLRSVGDSHPLALAAAWQGSEGRSPLEGLAVVVDPAAAEVAWIPVELLTDPAVDRALAALVAGPSDGGRPVAAHQAKALMRSLLGHGVDVRCLVLDTAIAAYLLDPGEGRYLLDEVLRRYAGAELPADGAAAEGQLDLDGSGVSVALRTARHALAVDRLVDPLEQALDAHALRALNDEIEVPLVRVLALMEHVGVGVDADELRALRDRLTAEVERLRAQVWEDAGVEFNVNSTPQLRE